MRNLTKEEIEEAYEKNTGVLIADDFEEKNKDYIAVPGVLCKNHGVFTWGKDAHEAVHNAVVVEEVAKMAARCEMINPTNQPAPQELQDKHYFRKHGANAILRAVSKLGYGNIKFRRQPNLCIINQKQSRILSISLIDCERA